MKARTLERVKGLTKAAIALIIAAVVIFAISAGLSTINKGCWAICLLELVPLIVFSVSNDGGIDTFRFCDFEEDKYKKKIILFEDKYYRAYNFRGVYLRERIGYNSVQEIMDKYPNKEKENVVCSVIGDV